MNIERVVGYTSVSCASASLCVAVGSGGDAVITTDPAAAKPTWSVPMTIGGQLNGVSCPSISLCVAVDASGRSMFSTNPTAASPIWTVPSTIDAGNDLTAVSCPSTSLCVAVDSVGNAVIGEGSGALPPASISPPTISGRAIAGQVLTAAHGSWTSSPTSYRYRWERCDGSGENCSAISGATRQTYRLTASDGGHRIRVQVSARNASGAGGTATSVQTTVVIPSTAQIKAILVRDITPHGKGARIAALLKKLRYTLSFNALTAGRIVIDWYSLPSGARVASGKPKRNAVLVAEGEKTLSGAGMVTVAIRLTTDGKRVLKHAKRLTLTAQGTFTIPGRRRVTATRKFTLVR